MSCHISAQLNYSSSAQFLPTPKARRNTTAQRCAGGARGHRGARPPPGSQRKTRLDACALTQHSYPSPSRPCSATRETLTHPTSLPAQTQSPPRLVACLQKWPAAGGKGRIHEQVKGCFEWYIFVCSSRLHFASQGH